MRKKFLKKIVALLTILCSFQLAQAQKKQNVYFFKNSGKEVKVKDSADFIRIIQEPDSGDVNFNLLEFYADGKKKTIGKLSAFDPKLVYEGVIARFAKSGLRVSASTYENGGLLGMSFYYHSNGKVKKQIEYVKSEFVPEVNQMVGIDADFNNSNLGTANSKLVFYADSLGKVLVDEGNGHLIEITKIVSGERKGERIEEGSYKDGRKDGLWTGKEEINNLTFSETYSQGKLVSGESIVGDKKYTYTSVLTPPEFRGGKEGWRDYLSRTIKYPRDAAERGISGVVVIQFVVDKEGKLTDAKAMKSLYPTLDEEATRIFSWSQKWVPAKMRGIPIQVKYSQPVRFSLPRR
jgi:TonB family protein